MTTQPKDECDQRIYNEGRTVCVLAGASTAIEALVVRVREEVGVPLDWHYLGGRANVLTLAPPERDADILRFLKMAMPVWLSPPVDARGTVLTGSTRDG